MWRLLGILALVICSEAMPKKYAGIPIRKSPTPRAIGDRLDTNLVQPNNYNLQLTVTKDNLENKDFSGTVVITLTVSKETTSFSLHAKDIDIDEIKLSNTTADIHVTNENDTTNDFLTITTTDSLTTGSDYTLSITYRGKLSATDMEGFYRSSYTDDEGKTKYLAATQFEQMGARRAFPCFDEPFFKATFDISITYSDGYNALSNAVPGVPTQPGTGLNTVTFNTTPKMSTYLVAFIVSEFTCKDRAATSDKVPTSVCARSGTDDSMQTALETAPAALEAMKDFTYMAYNDLGIDKMTQAAIPDFAAGAMENWGLVTYREADLLWDKDESSNYYKQAVVTVIAHEFAHQWFGDYVTLDWWSDTFLNEGFATYFEYHAADKIQDKWELVKQFVIEQVQPVLVTDSSKDSKPLSVNVSTPDDIESRFDDISYNKGGTVLKMLQTFLGMDNFKKGLNTYLTHHAHEMGTPELLWTSFNDYRPDDIKDTPVETIMDNWTKKAGYPLLTVKQNDTAVTISQTRFLLSADATDKTKWYVPITYTTSADDTSKFTETVTQAWLKPDDDADLTITLTTKVDWIILNNQQVGYYRVDYDDTLLNNIKTALNKDNFGDIDEISRSQLVDDQLNLARAGKKKYLDVLKFLGFLKKDSSYYTWSSAFNGFSYLLKRTNDESIRKSLANYILTLMDALLKAVPITDLKTDNQIYTLNQVLALTWACNLNQTECLGDAKDRFIDYTTGTAPSANLKSIVYCNGLRQSSDAKTHYDFLFDKYTSTKLATEQVTILKALGCINDSDLRKQFLEEALGENVRIQDARYVFQSVYSNNGADGINDVLTFISEKYGAFKAHFGTESTLAGLISTVADLFTTEEQIETLATFLNSTTDLDDSITTAGNAAIAKAKDNLKTITNLETDLKEYFKESNNSASMPTYHLVNLALIGVVYLMFNFY